MVQSYLVYVSGADDKVLTDEITEDLTENESPTATERLDRNHELHRTEILTEITGLMSRDRMSASKCPSPNPEIA